MFDREKYVSSFSKVRAPEDTMDRVYSRLEAPGSGKLSRTGLIAAVLLPLFVVTALAAGLSRMFTSKPEAGEKLAGTMTVSMGSGKLEHRDLSIGGVSLVLSFDIEGECRKVYFKPGWLPGERHPSYPDKQGYTNIIYGTQGNSGDIICSISLYTGDRLKDKNYFFWGDTEVLRQEQWLDWQRLDVVETLEAEGKKQENNFLLLFSREHSYLLVIAGASAAGTDMGDLEKVAESLSINVTDSPAISSGSKTDFANIGLAWG